MDYSRYFLEKDGEFIIKLQIDKTTVNVSVNEKVYKAYKQMHYHDENINTKFYKKNVSLDCETFISTKYEYNSYVKQKIEEKIDKDKFLEIIKSKTTAKISLKEEILLKNILDGHSETEMALDECITRQTLNHRKIKL